MVDQQGRAGVTITGLWLFFGLLVTGLIFLAIGMLVGTNHRSAPLPALLLMAGIAGTRLERRAVTAVQPERRSL